MERKYTEQLPVVAPPASARGSGDSAGPTIVVQDSKQGWAEGLRALVASLYRGERPGYDTSLLRPAGSRLHHMGGRASGPKPLEDLFEFTIALFQRAGGRRLTPLECHDLMCKVKPPLVGNARGGGRRGAGTGRGRKNSRGPRTWGGPDGTRGWWWFRVLGGGVGI